MAALITSVMGNTDKVVEYIRECNSLGIDVLKPDINKSFGKFSVEGNNIRFGLEAVKNVGSKVIKDIVLEREKNGEFKDFIQFCKRIQSKDLNKRVIESLIKCGAFDSINSNRAQLMAGFEKILESITSDRKKNLAGQVSLFEMSNKEEENIYVLPRVSEFREKEKLSLEKEVLGMYISGHPLSQYERELKLNSNINNNILSQAKESYEEFLKLDNKDIIIGGIIINKTIKTTKRNDIMAFIELEDLYGSIEVIVFPRILQKYSHLIKEDNIVYVKGRFSIKEDENAKIIANEFEEIIKIEDKELWIKIKDISDRHMLSEIKNILNKYKGNSLVYIYCEKNKKAFKGEKSWMVQINEDLLNELECFLGKQNVKIKNCQN
ncbi:helix-hairpin-helix domain-containing protein [Tepidibacter formicigenes]|jgi:DNA polymerase-3 subunit alpha|uniref:OB-fold nucleic acid binding domain-containing protein n=1 Tax=Tepidibacter formicigenes DSM 15518 TaxID=1123349 RepID=A0A1M6JP96_9FIRM|nr:OB-fold nucleic acid binding domain-containing protein [Tepidibacter formicigenes]SHJ48510.1 OB-fold nucleic acid binding domain-containing protein [Tepidibacter formicigenes DSM 15518]